MDHGVLRWIPPKSVQFIMKIMKPWYEPWNASAILAKTGLGIQLRKDFSRDLVIHDSEWS